MILKKRDDVIYDLVFLLWLLHRKYTAVSGPGRGKGGGVEAGRPDVGYSKYSRRRDDQAWVKILAV